MGGGPTVLSMSRSGGYAARQIEYIEDNKGVVMDDYLKEALEITRAQAGVRVMSEEEIAAFIQKVAQGIKAVAEGETPVELDSGEMAVEARQSVKEKSVTCLEC